VGLNEGRLIVNQVTRPQIGLAIKRLVFQCKYLQHILQQRRKSTSKSVTKADIFRASPRIIQLVRAQDVSPQRKRPRCLPC